MRMRGYRIYGSPRTCIFDDPESELYNRLVPERGGVSISYWFIRNCPMKFRMCGNVCDTKFSRIARWTKFLRLYFRKCLLRFLLNCQDGCRVYCFWAAAVITADWLEEVLNCFWHVCPKAPYVLETCIDGKCSRKKCSRMWRHSRNSRKFRIVNISTHTVLAHSTGSMLR